VRTFNAAITSLSGLSGWTVRLPLPNGHTVSQIWGDTASRTAP
jgi:hypothetical protein